MKISQDIASFYSGKKIFLTGHTGFKGSWLSLWLSMMGAKVCGFSLEADAESLFNIAQVKKDLEESIIGDIRDRNKILSAIDKFKPEIIIHMAAQPLVRESYFDPSTTYETNVIGALNVFEAARKSGSVKAILNVTTDKCYENKESLIPYKESDRLGGYDPYSSSKACAEILTFSYYQSFFSKEGVSVGSARAGNVIGGGDFSVDRIIPDIFRAIRKGDDVEIRNPYAVRPWQHVLEPLCGYLLFTKKLFEGERVFFDSYNFGPSTDSEVTVENLLKLFIEKIGYGNYKIIKNEALHEAGLLKLDSNKARSSLGWEPKLSFDQAISWTAEWYKNYSEFLDPRKMTITQIENFTK